MNEKMTKRMTPESENNLEKHIKETVFWFSLFDYPLTAREIHRFLGMAVDYAEVAGALSRSISGLEARNGLYFPLGKSALTIERQKRYNYSDRKFKRALILASWFRRLPWLRLIALVNLMGANNLRDQGDIDLFIITAPRRIWLTRLLMAGTLKILNLRPRADRYKDTFCLSFFVVDDRLDFADLRLAEGDPYFRYWLASLTPIYDSGHYYGDLISANPWLKAELPDWQELAPSDKRLISNPKPQKARWKSLDWLEKKSQIWQMKHLPRDIADLLNIDTRVLADDNIIKLHSNDRRLSFKEKYRQAIK